MKILHVIPSVSERSGGPGHAIIPMCRSLQLLGAEVLVATTDAGMNESITRHIPANYKGIPTIFFPLQWGESFKYSRPLSSWLEGNVDAFDLVHIHAVFNHASLAAARACRRHKVPYIVRPLGTLDPWSMKQKSLRKLLFWQFAARQMLRGAAAVHYTAPAEQAATEQSLRLNHGQVVPLGIEPERDNGVVPMTDFAREFPPLRTSPYVLVLSRLHRKKGLDVFVDAFLALTRRAEFRQWRLVLAGEGPTDYVNLLKQKVSNQPGDPRVIFPGWLDGERKKSILRQASLLALPSHHENFGLCVLEAMAFGVPVFVSPQVNLAAEVEAADAGWIAPVAAGAIESTLAEALACEGELKRRGKAGRDLSQKFSWASVALRLNEMYLSVLR
jgi:glycosyltransferase involved in cell wall biosynthesis